MKDYKHLALLHAEKYGVIEYTVKNNNMVYYTNFPIERNTYKVTVNLDNNNETRQQMKRYYDKGNYNICL